MRQMQIKRFAVCDVAK